MFIKKALSILTSFALITFMTMYGNNPVTANAALKQPSASLLSAELPKYADVWNLSYSSFSGGGTASYSTLYSNYNFTGVKSMRVFVTNKRNANLKVRVYEYGGIFPYQEWTIVANKSVGTSFRTKSNQYYYIQFDAPCSFSYTVEKGSLK